MTAQQRDAEQAEADVGKAAALALGAAN